MGDGYELPGASGGCTCTHVDTELAAVVSKAPDTGMETLAVGHWPGNTDVVRVALQPAPADTHQGLKTSA